VEAAAAEVEVETLDPDLVSEAESLVVLMYVSLCAKHRRAIPMIGPKEPSVLFIGIYSV
jgi:hypothetical protein